MANFDVNTEDGNSAYWKAYATRIVLSFAGAWLGFAIGCWYFWRDRPDAMNHSVWSYAFWWALPIGLVVGIATMFRRHERDAARYAAERENHHASAQAEADAEAQRLAAYRASTTPLDRPYPGLTVGAGMGKLRERGHAGGVGPNYDGSPGWVNLAPEDTFKNIIIFGGIGSGKTTRAINPLLRQLLDCNTGALIFDIKTDFHEEVDELCRMTGRTYKVIGDGGIGLNLIGGCTPDLAASFLESCFLAKGQGSGDSSFWVSGAVDLCRNALQLIQLTGGAYTLSYLNRVILFDDERTELLKKMAEKFANGDYDEEQEIAAESTQTFFLKVWAEHDEKVSKGIKSTVGNVLTPLMAPGLAKAFSPGEGAEEADLPSMINEGQVFLVNIPRTRYGEGGSKFAYMLLKLGFMNMMRGRPSRRDWNQDRPVAFVCDEYQSIIDPISDTDFWDKSRSTRTIGMVSMQGVSSMVQALGKDTPANAILQNFRQRLVFRNEDLATLQMAQQILGQIDVVQVSHSEGSSVGWSQSHPSQNATVSTNDSQGSSQNYSRQALFEANDMRRLGANECLFLGNVGDYAVDEVVELEPLFLKGKGSQAATV